MRCVKLNPKLPAAELDAALAVMLQLAGGLLALVLLGAWTGGLGLGRSLQARLRRPGAFAQEFRALRFGRAYSLLVLAALAAAFGLRLAGGGLAVELALVLARAAAAAGPGPGARGNGAARLVAPPAVGGVR